jgi:tripartite-type tricarboxylate transporter receptor subunit TctC
LSISNPLRRRIMGAKRFRGFWFIFLLTFAVISLNSSWAAEQKYPSRAIEIYNPFAPGGIVDFLNRFTAKKLESYLGVSVVPQYKPGGGGMTLASYMASGAPADGYTLGNVGPEHVIQPILLGRASYTIKDFIFIGQLAVIPCVFFTSAEQPWNTFQDFLDYARKNPGVKFSTPGIGTTVYLRAENFNKNFKMGMVHVPFKGDAESMAAVLGKHVHVGAGSVGIAKAQVDAGKAKILFCFEPPEKVGLPANTPNLRSLLAGKPYVDIDPGQILTVPAKTPSNVTQVLEKAWERLSKDPEFEKDLRSVYLAVGHMDGKAFTQSLPARMAVVKEMLQLSGQLK